MSEPEKLSETDTLAIASPGAVVFEASDGSLGEVVFEETETYYSWTGRLPAGSSADEARFKIDGRNLAHFVRRGRPIPGGNYKIHKV